MINLDKYDVNKVDTSLMQEFEVTPPPALVPNRVLQLDADIACYECAVDTETLDTCKENLLALIETKRKYAGAEKVVLHLTGDLKGNRFNIATVKPYQVN